MAFNMGEDEVVASRSWKLLHELLEHHFGHYSKDGPKTNGPGAILHVLMPTKHKWGPKLWDAMFYLVSDRNYLVHKTWGFKLHNPGYYRDMMVYVFGVLAPNFKLAHFKLAHYNPSEERLLAVIANKDEYIANLEQQLVHKRRHEDEQYGYGGGAKRVRRGYDNRDRNYDTYDY
jgi:hypothetical protein